MAVLNFFLVQKLIFGHFWKCKKWNLVKKKFREINLFDFTSFFGLDFFLIFWPTVMVVRYIYIFIFVHLLTIYFLFRSVLLKVYFGLWRLHIGDWLSIWRRHIFSSTSISLSGWHDFISRYNGFWNNYGHAY